MLVSTTCTTGSPAVRNASVRPLNVVAHGLPFPSIVTRAIASDTRIHLQLNAVSVVATWTTTTNWTFTTTLSPGQNTLVATGVGRDGAALQPRDLGPYSATNIVYY